MPRTIAAAGKRYSMGSGVMLTAPLGRGDGRNDPVVEQIKRVSLVRVFSDIPSGEDRYKIELICHP